MQRILAIAGEIGSRTVMDGGTSHTLGLVATEFLVAAILVDGSSVAADIISRVSRGSVNSWNLLEAIHVDPSTLHPPAASLSYEVESIHGGANVTEAWEPVLRGQLPEIGNGAWCEAPVPYANWLILNRFMIGETPGGDCYSSNNNSRQMQHELSALVPTHVDTFVSLRGEWGPMAKFLAERYPKDAAAANLNCDCLFFPIEDFRVTALEDVCAIVLECRRRLRRGERLYMHCRSGHGRTGMICIPLIASLFDVSAEQASIFVQTAHDVGRNGGSDAGWHLPETAEQVDLVRRVNDLVRQSDLAATGGSSSSSRR
jgi:hypothetical protein